LAQRIPLAMCEADTATTVRCQHAYDMFARVCLGGRPCECAELYCLDFCEGETIVSSNGAHLQVRMQTPGKFKQFRSEVLES